MLTDRDEEILGFVGKFGVVNERHLIELMGFRNDGTGFKNLGRILDRLEKGGYLERQKIRWKEPGYVLIGENGAAILNTRKPKGVILHTLAHDMLTIDLYLLIRERGEIQTEQVIRHAIGLEAARKVKIPDLVLNDNTAYEVEISEKSTARLQKIINEYCLNTKYSRVNYFVKSEAIGGKIYAMSRGDEKFKVYLFDGQNFKTARELPRNHATPQQRPAPQPLGDDRISRFKHQLSNA